MNHNAFINCLREARALLQKGWTQGTYCEVTLGMECYCLMGALSHAGIPEGSFRWKLPGGRYAPNATAALVSWNDDRKRTVKEVLACIDNSIAALE